MAKRTAPEITESELVLMKEMWRFGPRSAREIHDAVWDVLGWAYTTTRSTLDRMVAKRLVRRKTSHGLYLYAAAISRPLGLAVFIERFSRRVLGRNPMKVVPMFVEGQDLTRQELAELRRLIEEMES